MSLHSFCPLQAVYSPRATFMYSPALSQIIPYLTLVDMGPDPLHSCHSLRVRSSPSRPLSVAAVNTTKATSTYLPPLSQSPPYKAPPTHSSKSGAISSPRLSFIEIAWLPIAAVECSGSRYNQNHLTSTYLHPSFPHLTPYKAPPTFSTFYPIQDSTLICSSKKKARAISTPCPGIESA